MGAPLEDFGPDWLVKRLQKESGKDYMLLLPFSLAYQDGSYYITIVPNTDHVGIDRRGGGDQPQARVDQESGKAIPQKIRRELLREAMKLEWWEHFLLEYNDLEETSLVGEWKEVGNALKGLEKSADRLTPAQRKTLASLINGFDALAEKDPTQQVGKLIQEHEEYITRLVGNHAEEKEWQRLLNGYDKACKILTEHQREAEPVLQACQEWLGEVKDHFPARRWWSFLRYQRCVKEVESSANWLSFTLEQLLFEELYTLVEK
ncbi:hypothetical protein [Desmospora activa]|uniref:Uncharacterized protein n=1 Tax=Desmospora activa DSM 45169 TaxID=1121389 RepID=A0A2T4ZCR8_9BACL|nr:hypothetical protein [Desmospora activa]PTM59676.1 hypothetical protein C8J48_2306 [Desmospora activa DSM 45169]